MRAKNSYLGKRLEKVRARNRVCLLRAYISKSAVLPVTREHVLARSSDRCFAALHLANAVCSQISKLKKCRTKAALNRLPCPAFRLIKRDCLKISIASVNNDAAVILRLIAAIACNRLARKQQGKRCSLARCAVNAYFGMVKLQKLVNDGHTDA